MLQSSNVIFKFYFHKKQEWAMNLILHIQVQITRNVYVYVCLSPSQPKYKQLKLWILKNEAHLNFFKATGTEYNKNIRNKRRMAPSWTAWPLKMGPIRFPETSVKTTNLRSAKSQNSTDIKGHIDFLCKYLCLTNTRILI